MATFTDALIYLRPGANFSNKDDTLAGLRWDTPGVVPPTQQEFDAAFAALANPVPKVVAAGSMIRALTQLGKLDAVDAAGPKASPLPHRLGGAGGPFPSS